MIISLDWIKEFVTLPVDKDIHDFANALTMATAEVEEVHEANKILEKIIAVKIISFKSHPNAEKLRLVTFSDGVKQFEVVCGAPNVRVDLIVPYAPLGVTLPNGMKLEAKEIRGIWSQGMLCSATELGLGVDSSGLLELPVNTLIGTNLAQVYGHHGAQELLVIDNKSLTHRPDLWGMYGFAREFAAIYHTHLKPIVPFNWAAKIAENSNLPVLNVRVASSSQCTFFSLIQLSGWHNAPTPDWIKSRLESVGVRSLNLAVDITNYVMFELGIPLHAYDRSKVKGSIVVQALEQGVDFKTLDGVVRTLAPGDVLISDEQKPLVLAGIMGGEDCIVTESTQELLLEAAIWNAQDVRKTSTRLGLRSESSARFEKTLDPKSAQIAFSRALELFFKFCPKLQISAKPFLFADEKKLPARLVKLHLSYLYTVLGMQVSHEKIKNILYSLEFKISSELPDCWILEVPSFRAQKDITIEEDIIEELARMIGYDSLPISSPLTEILPLHLSKDKSFLRKSQDFFVYNAQAFEVMTYPLIGKDLLHKSAWVDDAQDLVLVNALSEEADRMRPSLIPSLLQTVAKNCKNITHFRLFEFGRIYSSVKNDFAKEAHHLALAFVSKWEHQLNSLYSTVETYFKFLHLPVMFHTQLGQKMKLPASLVSPAWTGLHPSETLYLESMGNIVGFVTTVHPYILRNFKLKSNVHIAVIDCSYLMPRGFENKTKFNPISLQPDSYFDCCIEVKKETYVQEIIELLWNVVQQDKLKEITKIKVLDDYFSGSHQQRFVTFRLTFESAQETITSERLKILENIVLDSLGKAGFFLRKS